VSPKKRHAKKTSWPPRFRHCPCQKQTSMLWPSQNFLLYIYYGNHFGLIFTEMYSSSIPIKKKLSVKFGKFLCNFFNELQPLRTLPITWHYGTPFWGCTPTIESRSIPIMKIIKMKFGELLFIKHRDTAIANVTQNVAMRHPLLRVCYNNWITLYPHNKDYKYEVWWISVY